jgi:hypothetical protein
MSKVAIEGNALGSGTFTIASPNTNSSYTLSLPQATTTLVGTDATQTLTNKTWASPASSTISSATAQASTSGTSIDFTGIPSWVKRITVMFDGVSLNGNSSPIIQLGDSGGVETTGYKSSSAYLLGGTASNQVNSTSGIILFAEGSSNTISGSVVFINFSSNTWLANGSWDYDNLTGYVAWAVGEKTLSATLDRVRITTANGTDAFDAGSINILYE